MLVLTRKPGEIVKIGNDIEVMVVRTSGRQVKLGIKAPSEIIITREELCHQTQDNQKEQD